MKWKVNGEEVNSDFIRYQPDDRQYYSSCYG